MKLGYFTMPLHPMERNYTETLRQDREAILLAERLGFAEAFVGEHTTDALETIPSSLLFLASLAHDTKTIRLGSGTVNLPHRHPAATAAEVAMLDHLLGGRFIFGISSGALRSDAEAYGTLEMNRTEMMVEAMDHILAIWSGEPPYRLKGKYWTITTERSFEPEHGQGIMLRPLQKPHPPIVVTVIDPHSPGIVEAGRRGWTPISANFVMPHWVATHWPSYRQGCEKAGRVADPADWRIAKSVFVADDDRAALAYGRRAGGPYHFYYRQMKYKMERAGRLGIFKRDPSEPDDALDLDRILDGLVIAGSVNSAIDQILALRETVGEFGTLVYAGHDWSDENLSRRSMELMAERVMPAVNEAIKRGAAMVTA